MYNAGSMRAQPSPPTLILRRLMLCQRLRPGVVAFFLSTLDPWCTTQPALQLGHLNNGVGSGPRRSKIFLSSIRSQLHMQDAIDSNTYLSVEDIGCYGWNVKNT